MRRSSSTTSRCGASSGSVAGSSIALLLPLTARFAGARDQPQHALAIVSIDHGGEEAPRRLVRAGAEPAKGAHDALGLQTGQLERQRLAFRRDVEQPLTAVLRAFLLHDVGLIDQLL